MSTEQPTPGTSDPISIPRETPEQRATIIAGLRALAQFLEDNPSLPCPQAISAQHSFLEPLNLRTYERVPVPDAEKIAFVQAAAGRLNVEPNIDEANATLRFTVAPKTEYVVHAQLRGGEQA